MDAGRPGLFSRASPAIFANLGNSDISGLFGMAMAGRTETMAPPTGLDSDRPVTPVFYWRPGIL